MELRVQQAPMARRAHKVLMVRQAHKVPRVLMVRQVHKVPMVPQVPKVRSALRAARERMEPTALTEPTVWTAQTVLPVRKALRVTPESSLDTKSFQR